MGGTGRALFIVLVLGGSVVLTGSPVAALTSSPQSRITMAIPTPTILTVFVSGARVGYPICLEAELTADGYPLRNRTIVFALLGAPVGSAMTGISGRAAMCVTAAIHGGTYPNGVGAGFAGDPFFAPSNGSAELTIWPVETFVHPFPTSGPYLETATFVTQLTFSLVVGIVPGCVPTKFNSCAIVIDVPLPGRTVFFFRVGVLVGSAVTDANGLAVLPDVPLSGLNSFIYEHGFTAVFAGEADYAGGTVSNTLTVEPQPTTLLVATAVGTSGGSTTVSGLLRFGGGLPLADRLVVFYLNGAIVGTATTTDNGIAMLADVSLEGVAPGAYATGVQALFLGELNFYPTAGSATLLVAPAGSSSAD